MEKYLQEEIEALQALIRIDSVKSAPKPGAPFGEGNAECLSFVLSLAASYGFDVKNVEGYCGWAEVGKGELFGILTHVDVVPISGVWKHEPFGGEISGGYLYGRGAQDDKGPAIAALFAARRLLAEGLTPTKRVRFIFGCDEESSWGCMERYKETEEMPAIGISPDADFPVINCEKGVAYHFVEIPLPAGIVSLNAGTRANMVPDFAEAVIERSDLIDLSTAPNFLNIKEEGENLRITVRGKSAHGSTPQEGVNALSKLLEFLGSRYSSLLTINRALSDYTGRGADLNVRDEESGALTLNLGVAETIGDKILFSFDIRHPISITKEEITLRLERALAPYTVVAPYWYGKAFHDPLYLPKDDPLVKTLLAAYDKIMGGRAEAITIGGATYARFLPYGVAFGPVFPGEKSTIHQADERISLAALEQMTDIYYEALKALCFS